MNKINKILPLAMAVMASVASADAQNTYSGYFIDNYAYRHEMNPAFGNDDNMVSMPGLGNVNIGMQGNLHLRDVIYTIDGKTVLFTNPGITASQVMKGIGDKNKVGAGVRLDIVNVGFKALGGYNTVGINVRSHVNASVPGELFRLAKEGVENSTYDISGLRLSADAYAEIALGHSRNINSQWRVGATLKVLLGGGNIDAYMNRATLSLGQDNWKAITDATVYSSVKGLTYKHDINNDTGHEYVSGIDMDSYSFPSGFGLGLDLGAVYTPCADWQFSAALLDFGFISWSDTRVASTNGPKSFETDAYTFNVDDNASNSFSNEWDKFRDNLSALYELDDNGIAGTRTRMLAATINLGARYNFPLYRNLTFGFLSSTRINGPFTTTSARLSANVTPMKWIDADANFAVGTYGCSFGWLVNFKAPVFNFFVGMDHTMGKLCKQGIPLSSNAEVNAGINFMF